MEFVRNVPPLSRRSRVDLLVCFVQRSRSELCLRPEPIRGESYWWNGNRVPHGGFLLEPLPSGMNLQTKRAGHCTELCSSPFCFGAHSMIDHLGCRRRSH